MNTSAPQDLAFLVAKKTFNGPVEEYDTDIEHDEATHLCVFCILFISPYSGMCHRSGWRFQSPLARCFRAPFLGAGECNRLRINCPHDLKGKPRIPYCAY